jgi:poly(3-hydroxyoctanoate) depolymerase
MQVHERMIRVDGVRLHMRETGDGPPVLLINGIGAHTAMWGTLEPALAGFRLIEFDAPGTGRSAMLPYPVTIPALAWLAARLLDTLEVQRADVLGYSMGGFVAQQLAASTPERARRLVLVSTSCGWGGIPGELGAMVNVATPLRYWSPAFYRRTIGGLAGGRARRDPEWVDRHGEMRRRHPPTTWGYFGQVMSSAGWSGLSLLRLIRQPTLVVTGDDDPLVPKENAVLLAGRLPRARVLMAPGEGHLLLMDAASTVLEPIRDFLAADSVEDSAAWRYAREVGEEEMRAAGAASRRGAQPWGTVSWIMRALNRL